jgi:predicted transcriptional regulator
VAFHIGPIAYELRRIREEQGVTQTAVAAKSGLNQTYLSKIEREKVDPRFTTVQDVARSLDYELILIPRNLVQTVSSLVATAGEQPIRPLISAEPD